MEIDPNDSTANNYTLDISLNSNNQVVLEEAFDFENSYMSWDSCTVFAQFDSEGDEVSVSMSIKWDNINDSLPYFTVTEYYINECNGDDRGTECGGTPGDPNDTSDTRLTYQFDMKVINTNVL